MSDQYDGPAMARRIFQLERELAAARRAIQYLVDHSGRYLPKHQAAINAAIDKARG